LLAQRNQPGGYDAPLTLPHAVSENFTATLEVGLVGVVTGEHHLKLRVNGSEVYAGSWHGRTYHIASAVFSQTALVDGPNTIRVELSVDDSGQALDLSYLDFISLRYWRNLVAEEDQIFF